MYKLILLLTLSAFALPAMSADRCFDGFRLESLVSSSSVADEKNIVNFSFSYPVKAGDPAAIVINTAIDVTRPGTAFVLNAATHLGYRVGLCFSDAKEIAIIEKALKKNLGPREELNAKSLTEIRIPYTRD